ncbi:J domain-containing protein [Chloroflexota bacterium]
MANFNEIDEARRLLGLGEAATLKELKSAYRRLAHRHHPDKHGSATEENDVMMKKLNRAYKLLMDYCNDYKYGFREEDIGRTYAYEEEMRKWRENWFNSI